MKKIILFFYLCSFSPLCLAAQGILPNVQFHKQIWNDIDQNSWRSARINTISGGQSSSKTILELLISSFILDDSNIRDKIRTFLNHGHTNFVPQSYNFDYKITDNARTWQRKLSLRELFRFKNIFNINTNLINDHNFQNDDLIKIRSLCGTFCSKDSYGDYNPIFTGMLVPNQTYKTLNNETYDVHTCLHGFFKEQINNIYFIPYGLPIDDEYAFQVKNINIDDNGALINFSQNDLDQYSLSDNTPYQTEDYCLVKINAHSENNKTLKEVMARNGIPNFPTQHNDQNLPNIQGFSGNFDLSNNNKFNKIFVIGRASLPEVAFKNDFVVVTNLTPSSYNDNSIKKRSHINDPDSNANPTHLGPLLPGEFTFDYPTYPGMSGAPVLGCKLTNGNPVIRRCRIFGVNWGSERFFDDSNQLTNLKSIVSSIR